MPVSIGKRVNRLSISILASWSALQSSLTSNDSDPAGNPFVVSSAAHDTNAAAYNATDGAFEVHYQPCVSLGDDAITGRGDRCDGSIGLDRADWESGQAEIGYWVAPWARRRGYATEAVRAGTLPSDPSAGA